MAVLAQNRGRRKTFSKIPNLLQPARGLQDWTGLLTPIVSYHWQVHH